MPIYEYRCSECGNRFEEILPSSSSPAPPCPSCGAKKIEKLISAPGAVGVAASPGPEIQDPPATQVKGGLFEDRERLAVRAIELLDIGRLVVPEVGVNHDLGRGCAAMEVEESAPQRPPASAVPARIGQRSVHALSSNAVVFSMAGILSIPASASGS